jgi:L-asparagine transporter-like permease
MSNLYYGLTAIIGTVTLCVGLSELIPQGMWLYLFGTVQGTALTTWAVIELKSKESK